MTGCLFNQLVYCMAIFTNKKQKQVKIFTVIYYKMPIPCNNMVIPLKTPISRDPAVSCGILWYPAVIRLPRYGPVSLDLMSGNIPLDSKSRDTGLYL